MDLIIIGNGFDINEGLDTSYYDFRSYLENNNPDLIESLKFYYSTIFDRESSDIEAVDFDFSVKKIPCRKLIEDALKSEDEFFSYIRKHHNDLELPEVYNLWSSLEQGLGNISYTSIRSYFGFGRFPIYNYEELMSTICDDFKNTLQKLKIELKNWVRIINTNSLFKKKFFKPAKFISFNYTSTLEDRYSVDNKDICYIHNSKNDAELEFGCSSENIDDFLEYQMEYVIEEPISVELQNIIRKNIKDTTRIIHTKLRPFISNYNFENIYIFGSSLSDVDEPYFKFLRGIYPNAIWNFTYYLKDRRFNDYDKDKKDKEKYIEAKNIKNYSLKEINSVLNSLSVSI